MTFGDRVVGAMKLDPNAFEDVERDPTAMAQAVGVIALAAVSLGIGNIWYGGMSGIVLRVIGGLIGYVFWALVIWLVGTRVMPDPATKADFPEAFRVIAFAAAPQVLGVITIIPMLGYLLSVLLWIWSIAAMVVATKAVLDYTDTFKAVIVVLIGFCAYWLVMILLGMMFFGAAIVGSIFGR